MGKATINSHLGDGEYSITTVFDKAAAQAQKAKLEAVLAKVDERLAEDPGPEIEEQRILLIRKTALEQEIARISEASELARTQAAWCADLVEDLSGTVGTIEIDTDARDGLMIQPGYAGNAAYDAARDAIEMPFRTLPVADAVLNFALMPAIQKWRPTYRYGTISNVNQGASTCDLTLANANSRIRGININETTYFSGVPIEYMTCDGAPFADDDEVVVKFDPYDVEGTIKVIGFKSEPKPCESRHILIETTWAWLLWDIVGKRPAYNLGEGAPTFPCEKTPDANTWIANHVTDDADDTLYAYIVDTFGESYINPERDFGPINEYWYNHFSSNELITEYFLGGFGCNAPGWGSSEDSAVCWGYTDQGDRNNPFYSAVVSHLGEDPETTYGKNWGLWSPECCKYDYGPLSIPRYFTYRNSYREWRIWAAAYDRGFNKLVSSNGSEGNRSFMLLTDGYGETFKNYSFPFYVSQEHYYEFTLHFYGPFEVDELSTSIDLYDYPASSVNGIDVDLFSTQVQTKHNKNDMVGVCAFSWKIHDKSGGADRAGEESPHSDWYVQLDFNPEAEADPVIPNPWGSNLVRDDNLSTAFRDMVREYDNGLISGFQYRFVDVT